MLALNLGLADTAVAASGIAATFSAAGAAHPWRWRLLYVGRLHPDKGIEEAVRCLAHLPEEATPDRRRQLGSTGRDGVGAAGRRARVALPRAHARAPAPRSGGRALPDERCSPLPGALGGALGARAAGGHGLRLPGRGHRARRERRVPARRRELSPRARWRSGIPGRVAAPPRRGISAPRAVAPGGPGHGRPPSRDGIQRGGRTPPPGDGLPGSARPQPAELALR